MRGAARAARYVDGDFFSLHFAIGRLPILVDHASHALLLDEGALSLTYFQRCFFHLFFQNLSQLFFFLNVFGFLLAVEFLLSLLVHLQRGFFFLKQLSCQLLLCFGRGKERRLLSTMLF
ncbi:MAG: hypothetical protein K0S07_1288 [Chlamydiales bacterium]|nr:hypothetical protein [Chlamydiales bacterium]